MRYAHYISKSVDLSDFSGASASRPTMARNAFTDEFSLVNWEDPRLFDRAVLVLSPRVKSVLV